MKDKIKEFVKIFPRKCNIPLIIWFVVNLAIMLFGNLMVVSAAYGENLQTSSDLLFGVAVIGLSVVMYAVGIAVSFSPVGDWLVRIKNGCEKIDGHDQEERIRALFEEVVAKAKQKNPTLPDNIKIFIKDEDEINAYAFGRKTVCVTSALLERSDDEIKGVIAHEIGHIANHDTDLLQVVNVANIYVTLYAIVVWAFVMFYKGAFKAVAWIFTLMAGSIGEAIMMFMSKVFIDILLTAIITATTFIWTSVGNILMKEAMKKSEFEADRFACELGYIKPFVLLLNEMRQEECKRSTFKKVIAYMSTDHPSADSRLRELRRFYCAKA